MDNSKITGKESENRSFLVGFQWRWANYWGQMQEVSYTQTATFLNRNVANTTKINKKKWGSALIIHSDGVDEPVGFSELLCVVLDKIDTRCATRRAERGTSPVPAECCIKYNLMILKVR